MNLLQKAMSAMSFVFGRNPTLGGLPGSDPTLAGVNMNFKSVLGLSAAWACVNLLSGTIASLPIMIYRTDANGIRTEARDHPLYRLLRSSPNADQTAMDFWEGGVVRLELAGDLIAEIDRVGSRIVALSPINSPTVTRQSDGSIRYRWTQFGVSRDEPQENVFHVRGFGGDPLGGMSTLSYGRQIFGLAAAENLTAQRTFANGLKPSGVVTFDKFLTPEQRGPIQKDIETKYAGAMNAGRPMVLEGGSNWTQVSITPEDAQMLQSRAFSIEEVCRLFGVPPFMIGHNEKSSGYPASLEQQMILFSTMALRKRLRRIEQAIEKQLLTPLDRSQGVSVEFNMEGLLRGDSVARAQFYEIMSRIGMVTINEGRRLENKPPVPGGDVPRIQMQNVPLTETVQPKPVANGN